MTLGFFWQCIYMHIKSHITALNPLSYKYKHVVVTIYKDCSSVTSYHVLKRRPPFLSLDPRQSL